MRWHKMEDKEVEDLYNSIKDYHGDRIATFIFWLSEASEDYKIKEGIVYRRVEDE